MGLCLWAIAYEPMAQDHFSNPLDPKKGHKIKEKTSFFLQGRTPPSCTQLKILFMQSPQVSAEDHDLVTLLMLDDLPQRFVSSALHSLPGVAQAQKSIYFPTARPAPGLPCPPARHAGSFSPRPRTKHCLIERKGCGMKWVHIIWHMVRYGLILKQDGAV